MHRHTHGLRRHTQTYTHALGRSEEYDVSVCLFHAMYGGDVLPIEFRNTHPSSSYKVGLWGDRRVVVIFGADLERMFGYDRAGSNRLLIVCVNECTATLRARACVHPHPCRHLHPDSFPRRAEHGNKDQFQADSGRSVRRGDPRGVWLPRQVGPLALTRHTV